MRQSLQIMQDSIKCDLRDSILKMKLTRASILHFDKKEEIKQSQQIVDLREIKNKSETSTFNLLNNILKNNQYFIYCGPLLINLNPGPSEKNHYLSSKNEFKDKPHVYNFVEYAYQSMSKENKSQTVSLLGGLGSGKTFNMIHCIEYICNIAVNPIKQKGPEIFETIHKSIQLLHIMGSIFRNNNLESTSFGLKCALSFDNENYINGFKLEADMLDVTLPFSDTGRSFTVLHSIVTGASTEVKKTLELTDKPEDMLFFRKFYKSFNKDQLEKFKLNDLEVWNKFHSLLNYFLFNKQEILEIIQLLSIVMISNELAVGKFCNEKGENIFKVFKGPSSRKLADKLGISEEEFLNLTSNFKQVNQLKDFVSNIMKKSYNVCMEFIKHKLQVYINLYFYCYNKEINFGNYLEQQGIITRENNNTNNTKSIRKSSVTKINTNTKTINNNLLTEAKFLPQTTSNLKELKGKRNSSLMNKQSHNINYSCITTNNQLQTLVFPTQINLVKNILNIQTLDPVNNNQEKTTEKNKKTQEKIETLFDKSDKELIFLDFPGEIEEPTLGGLLTNIANECLNSYAASQYSSIHEKLLSEGISIKYLQKLHCSDVTEEFFSENGFLNSIDKFVNHPESRHNSKVISWGKNNKTGYFKANFTTNSVVYDLNILSTEISSLMFNSTTESIFKKSKNSLINWAMKKIPNKIHYKKYSIGKIIRNLLSNFISPLKGIHPFVIYCIPTRKLIYHTEGENEISYMTTISYMRKSLIMSVLYWEWFGFHEWVEIKDLIDKYFDTFLYIRESINNSKYNYIKKGYNNIPQPDFKKMNKYEKVSCILVTFSDANKYVIGQSHILFKKNSFGQFLSAINKLKNKYLDEQQKKQEKVYDQRRVTSIINKKKPNETKRSNKSIIEVKDSANCTEIDQIFKGETSNRLSLKIQCHLNYFNLETNKINSFNEEENPSNNLFCLLEENYSEIRKIDDNPDFKDFTNYKKTNNVIIPQQDFFERVKSLLTNKDNYKYISYEENATEIIFIQSVARAYKVRLQYKTFKIVVSSCCKIQALVKGVFLRRNFKRYIQILYSTIFIQRLYKYRFNKRKTAVIHLQRSVKVYIYRCKVIKYLEKKKKIAEISRNISKQASITSSNIQKKNSKLNINKVDTFEEDVEFLESFHGGIDSETKGLLNKLNSLKTTNNDKKEDIKNHNLKTTTSRVKQRQSTAKIVNTEVSTLQGIDNKNKIIDSLMQNMETVLYGIFLIKMTISIEVKKDQLQLTFQVSFL